MEQHRLKTPDGLDILVTRIPLDGGDPDRASRTQLAVFINTESLVQDHFDPEDGRSGAGAGTPEMEVILNDAVLYDCEPDTEGLDKAARPPAEIAASLRAVLDYDMPTEQADYEREGEPEGHVFEHLTKLSEWIGG